jgi:hypothetical protein
MCRIFEVVIKAGESLDSLTSVRGKQGREDDQAYGVDTANADY